MITVTTAAAKGGAGKTTTVVALACRFAARGQRVLVVDMDPQATTSYYLGVRPERTVAELIVPGPDAPSFAQVATQTVVPGVWLLPSERTSLDRVDRFIVTEGPTGYERLLDALEPAIGHFDIALIDTAPQIVGLTEMSLITADAVLATMLARASYYPGVADMLANVSRIRRKLNPDIRELGVVVCDVPDDDNARTALELVRESGWNLLGAVHRSVLPEKSFRRGLPFMLSDPKKKVSVMYADIADTILKDLDIDAAPATPLVAVPADDRIPMAGRTLSG